MNDTFLHDLRRALNHLYDPDVLGRSPLCAVFGIGGSYERAIKLQRILEDAIQALRPSSGQAGSSRKRHLYDLLTYRYLQQFSQKEVADQLGISVSQLARDQQAALQALAMHLWGQHGLADRWQAVYEPAPSSTLPAPDLATRRDELAWMAVPSPEKRADVKQNLAEVLNLTKPLLARYHAHVDMVTPDNLPPVTVHPVALRQILLNLLSALLQSMAGGSITAECKTEGWYVRVDLIGEVTAPDMAMIPPEAGLETQAARQLIELSGGHLRIERTTRGDHVSLYLPVFEGTPVLVIDDSVDHLNLLQRYLANTRYRLLPASDAEQGLDMAAHTQVAVVIVDIMMPRTDGWAVLEQLRITPATADCPVVVCSILPLQELALSLGSHAFLGKPVSQHDLLATLDRLMVPPVSGSHSPPGRNP